MTELDLDRIEEIGLDELGDAINRAIARLELLQALYAAKAADDRRRIERLIRELRERQREPRWDGEYDSPGGDPIPYYRCDGALICWDCWRPYTEHPNEPREECLTVLCNGWHVKL